MTGSEGGRDPGDEGRGRRRDGLRSYLRFLHLGTQLALTILLGVFGGIWLDGKLGTEPIATVLGSLVGIGIGLGIVIRGTGTGR